MLKESLEKEGLRALGVPVKIEDVSFSLFSGEAVIKGLSVRAEGFTLRIARLITRGGLEDVRAEGVEVSGRFAPPPASGPARRIGRFTAPGLELHDTDLRGVVLGLQKKR